MEIIRLTTWIAAPEERCFRLATCATFHEALAKGVLKRNPNAVDEALLIGGDELIWPGHRAGMQLKYTTRISSVRPTGYFREVLVTGRHFVHLEHDHHFTPLNEGTRVRDEVRYRLLSPGPAGLLVAPLVRRYLTSRIALRNQLLKAAAESDVWRRYLIESASAAGNSVVQANPGPSMPRDKTSTERLPHGQVAQHHH
jgi:ligand-binding SRPBCC domain-containing protein